MATQNLIDFEAWLTSKGTRSKKAISDAVSRVKRIMEEYDLDGWYSVDQCKSIRALFNYPRQAEKAGLNPLVKIQFQTKNVYEGMQSLKDALNLYTEFLDNTFVH